MVHYNIIARWWLHSGRTECHTWSIGHSKVACGL